MTEQLVTQIVTAFGAPGAILGICVFALNRLHTQLTAAQEQRVADAKASSAMLLQLVAAQHEHTAMLTKAIDANTDATHDLRNALESPREAPINRRPQPPPPNASRR